jgi:hypothetical protein
MTENPTVAARAATAMPTRRRAAIEFSRRAGAVVSRSRGIEFPYRWRAIGAGLTANWHAGMLEKLVDLDGSRETSRDSSSEHAVFLVLT